MAGFFEGFQSWLAEAFSQLIQFDLKLFHFLNMEACTPMLDSWMPFLTDIHKESLFLGILVVIFIVGLIKNARKTGLVFASLLFALVLSDTAAYRLIKPLVGRQRPPDAGIELILRTNQYSGYGFPSNHAANSFALATILAFFFPKARWYFWGLALFVGYSRIYVGVHFPADILAGSILGYLCGRLAFFVVDSAKNMVARSR